MIALAIESELTALCINYNERFYLRAVYISSIITEDDDNEDDFHKRSLANKVHILRLPAEAICCRKYIKEDEKYLGSPRIKGLE